MKKQLDFEYKEYTQIWDIIDGNDPNFELLFTRESNQFEHNIRNQIWYYIKQRSNGLTFRLITESKFVDNNTLITNGRILVSLRLLNLINSFIYKQRKRQIIELLKLFKWFIYIILILIISTFLLIGIKKILLIRIFKIDFTNSIYFQYIFLMIFWALFFGYFNNEKELHYNY